MSGAPRPPNVAWRLPFGAAGFSDGRAHRGPAGSLPANATGMRGCERNAVVLGRPETPEPKQRRRPPGGPASVQARVTGVSLAPLSGAYVTSWQPGQQAALEGLRLLKSISIDGDVHVGGEAVGDDHRPAQPLDRKQPCHRHDLGALVLHEDIQQPAVAQNQASVAGLEGRRLTGRRWSRHVRRWRSRGSRGCRCRLGR